MAANAEAIEIVQNPNVTAKPSLGRRIIRLSRSYPLGAVGAVMIILVIIAAVAAPLLAPYEPTAVGTGPALGDPSSNNLLGTDQLGRDLLSRLIYGSRVSLLVGIIAVGIAAAIGVPLGLIAGYVGGIVDSQIMRIIDAIIAFPSLILALAFVATFGGGITIVMSAIGIAIMPQYARIVRAQTLAVKEGDFVRAARSLGATGPRVIVRHIAPNVWAPVLVVATLGLASAVIAEASLSFLGLGVKAPTPTWGNLLLDGFGQMQDRPLMSIAPGLAIYVLVLSFNLLGDALRDVLDPRQRGR